MSEPSKPEEVLDLFLFEDIYNNTNHYEDEWGITFHGDNYVLFNYETKELVNLKVTIGPGNFSKEYVRELAREEGWEIEGEELD